MALPLRRMTCLYGKLLSITLLAASVVSIEPSAMATAEVREQIREEKSSYNQGLLFLIKSDLRGPRHSSGAGVVRAIHTSADPTGPWGTGLDRFWLSEALQKDGFTVIENTEGRTLLAGLGVRLVLRQDNFIGVIDQPSAKQLPGPCLPIPDSPLKVSNRTVDLDGDGVLDVFLAFEAPSVRSGYRAWQIWIPRGSCGHFGGSVGPGEITVNESLAVPARGLRPLTTKREDVSEAPADKLRMKGGGIEVTLTTTTTYLATTGLYRVGAKKVTKAIHPLPELSHSLSNM